VGVIFHYLYLALPGMALSVGALAQWAALGTRRTARLAIGLALGLYAAASAATLWVVLVHVDHTGAYPALARPLGLNVAAAEAARSRLAPGAQVLVGGHPWSAEVLRFSLGYGVHSQVFDDCGDVPAIVSGIYLLSSERTPAAASLSAAGAPLLTRVPRPDDAFLILGPPTSPLTRSTSGLAECDDRLT
jgi:hypothetical protein